jgi:hypothetical protein
MSIYGSIICLVYKFSETVQMFFPITQELVCFLLRTQGCAMLTNKLMLLAKKANKVNALASEIDFKSV